MVSLVLSLLLIAKGTHAITIMVEGEEFKQEAVKIIETMETLGGAQPPILNLTSSCPCDKLLLSSLGPAATLQPKVMGVYTK